MKYAGRPLGQFVFSVFDMWEYVLPTVIMFVFLISLLCGYIGFRIGYDGAIDFVDQIAQTKAEVMNKELIRTVHELSQWKGYDSLPQAIINERRLSENRPEGD